MKKSKITIKSLNDMELTDERLVIWSALVICDNEEHCEKFMEAAMKEFKINYGGGEIAPEYSDSGRYEQDICGSSSIDHDTKSEWVKDLKRIAKEVNK